MVKHHWFLDGKSETKKGKEALLQGPEPVSITQRSLIIQKVTTRIFLM